MINKYNIDLLPNSAGVYIFYDKNKKLLYIGKAKNLKKRVSQYFVKDQKSLKNSILKKKIFYIDFLTTKSENEALVVEQNLISKNNPPFNIQLKDNKSFPTIIISDDEFPRIYLSRQYNKDKGFVSGPYLSSKTARKIYDFILENFKIRTCNKKLNKISSPCLNYYINQCYAPCKGLISKEDYVKNVKSAKIFLKGDFNDLLKDIKSSIERYSINLEYEKANELKNLYLKIENFKKDFSYNYYSKKITDFIGFFFGPKCGVISILRMAEGIKLYPFTKYFTYFESPKDIFFELVFKIYKEFLNFQNSIVPDEIISIYELEGIYKLFEIKNTGFNNESFEFINENKEKSIVSENEEKYNINLNNYEKNLDKKIIAKKFNNKKELEILKGLVRHCYTFHNELFPEFNKSNLNILKKIKDILNLKRVPKIIEGFDISNIGDNFIVGSSVRFTNGIKDKKNYRHYKIKNINYQNDFEAIKEVVLRRILHLQNEGEELPDLLLIDGGKPQINGVYDALEKINLKIDIIGLAKKEEILNFPYSKKEIKIDMHSNELKLFLKIRDEAHRFANRLRKIEMNKRLKK